MAFQPGSLGSLQKPPGPHLRFDLLVSGVTAHPCVSLLLGEAPEIRSPPAAFLLAVGAFSVPLVSRGPSRKAQRSGKRAGIAALRPRRLTHTSRTAAAK